MTSRSFILSILIAVSGCASPGFCKTGGVDDVRVGDTVVVELPGSTPSIRLVVDPDGAILLPFIGKMHVQGMTPSEARRSIRAAYHRCWPPDLEVSILRNP